MRDTEQVFGEIIIGLTANHAMTQSIEEKINLYSLSSGHGGLIQRPAVKNFIPVYFLA
jgi:hypothetical protein